MDIDEKFDCIFHIGSSVCSAFNGFSKSEILYCRNKTNWYKIRQFLLSSNPYEALINYDLNPISNLIDYFQLVIGSILTFDNDERLNNLIIILDEHDKFDIVFTHTKILKSLLALQRAGSSYNNFNIKINCKKLLAHIFKKFPKLLESNIVRSSKTRKFRFTEDDVQKYF
jgi:hypothetical protein